MYGKMFCPNTSVTRKNVFLDYLNKNYVQLDGKFTRVSPEFFRNKKDTLDEKMQPSIDCKVTRVSPDIRRMKNDEYF